MTDVLPSPAPAPAEAPLPAPTFDVLPLSAETRACLEKMGYQHPTPVQRSVYEPAVAGRDLVVQAQTGTGKTTAFGLPIVEHTVRRTTKATQVLCLCPTRELALQVTKELEKLGSGRSISLLAIYGGAPMGPQIEALATGVQVVIGTPGRVLDHLRRGTLDSSATRMLVLDEADEMLSMGFERDLHAILDLLPKERQTLLFSATLPPDIERMARERLQNPEFITLSGDAVGALSIAHYVYVVTEDKVQALLSVIDVENPESAIIFCNTKMETEAVAQTLSRRGYDADWLNGDLAQGDRERVMTKTRAGGLRFLVATDVAARGIDISHLTHVINYDFPESTETYVHRTGRTGRAGRTGTAISLVRPKDIGNLYFLRLTYGIRPLEKQIPTAGELRTRQESDLVQLVADAYARRNVSPSALHLAQRLLTHDRVENILAAWLEERFGDRASADVQATAARRARPPAVVSPELPVSAVRPVAESTKSPPTSSLPHQSSLENVSRRPRSRPSRPSEKAEMSVDAAPVTSESVSVQVRLEPDENAVEEEALIDGVEYAEIFVDVGRRDGARSSDLQRILSDRGGIQRRETGRIRLRDKHAFLLVRGDLADRAIVALSGATWGERTMRAELARQRPTDG